MLCSHLLMACSEVSSTASCSHLEALGLVLTFCIKKRLIYWLLTCGCAPESCRVGSSVNSYNPTRPDVQQGDKRRRTKDSFPSVSHQIYLIPHQIKGNRYSSSVSVVF